jgi:hypothetical protein
MSRWFRFYSEALDDPKVQNLDGETFKGWVNILCLAARHGGVLPSIEDIAFALRIDEIAAISLVDRLRIATLIDTLKGGVDGVRIAPHGWVKRQYKSDSSTERVKRFRNVSKPLRETAPETETETDIPLAKANGHSPPSDKVFWDSAVAYLGAGKRSVIGKWCKTYGQPETARAITAAQIERAVDPVAYITAALRSGGDDYGGVPIC